VAKAVAETTLPSRIGEVSMMDNKR
jgi:hypothetical protein